MSSHDLLTWLRAKHPEFEDLIDPLLASPTAMDAAWWRRFGQRRSKRTYRSLIVRAVLGDASLVKQPSSPPNGADLVRICRYFLTRPIFQDAPWIYRAGWHEAIGARLGAVLPRVSRKDPVRFLAALLVGDAWRIATDQPITEGPWAGLPKKAHRHLLPFMQQRVLTPADALRSVRHPTLLGTPWFRWYFETGVRVLDVRNCLVHARAVLDADRKGGRVQNHLPLQLSRTLGLGARSVPDTLAALDVIEMAVLGLINLDQIDPRDDFMRLRELLAAPVPTPSFWLDVFGAGPGRFVLDRSRARAWQPVASMYDTGLLFHPARCVGLIDGKAARMARFAPYYEAVNARRLRTHIRHYATEEVIDLLTRAQRKLPELVRGIRLRGTANVLMVLTCSAESVREAAASLPSVARFALGEVEPIPTGTGHRWKGKARQRPKYAPAFVRPLPPHLLDLGVL